MRNSLYFRSLFYLFILSLGINSEIEAQSDLYQSRSLEDAAIMSEGLYHQVLSSTDPYEELQSLHTIDQQKVISLLHTRYPELTYALERTPKMTLSSTTVASLMIAILKEEVAAEVVTPKDRFWQMISSATFNPEDAATFQFLYAYELFKSKRFSEAQKILDKIIKARKGEYEYAFYYSGLIHLIEGEYKDAEEKLKKIGQHDRLSRQTPYYLAAAHYGSKEYSTIVNFYSRRLDEDDLYNIDGITKIVAYAQFKSGDFKGAIASLNQLKKTRKLSAEENYVLGISYQKTGDQESSSIYLTDVATEKNNLAAKAKYEHALNMAEQGRNGAALSAFEELLNSGAFEKSDIHWNLAILNGRLQNYDKLAFHSIQLLEGPKKAEAIQLLSEVLDNIENETLFEKVALGIIEKTDDYTFLKSAVYNKALSKLKRNQKTAANKYFNLLATIDPLTEERGVVAAWNGIMAYQEGNYKRAIRLLSNYRTANADKSSIEKLDFDVAYFLGYAHFRMRDHSSALGYFSTAMELMEQVNLVHADINTTKDDLFLRMGDSYFLLDEHESAQRAYTRIISSDGKQKDYALWQNATIAELEGKPFDQIIILDELISTFPNSPYYHRAIFNTGNALFSINRYEKAAKFYHQVAASSAPTRLKEESKIQLGLISVNAGAYDQAASYFQELIRQSEDQEIVMRSNVALKEIYADYTYDTDAYLDLVANEATDKEQTIAKALFHLAKGNQEKGNNSEAIAQFNKFINDHPEDNAIPQAYYHLGQCYASTNNYENALTSFTKASGYSNQPFQDQAFDRAEQIAFNQLKNYKAYVDIRERRKELDTETTDTDRVKLKLATAHIALGDIDQMMLYGQELIQTNSISQKEQVSLVTGMITLLMGKKEWKKAEQLFEEETLSKIVNKEEKLIYQRALVYFNNNNLELATTAITDHYDTLLNEPAWLAKSIILLSDINVLQGDKESAAIALEALINSKNSIPPSLIKTAEDRLKALQLQN